MEVWRVLERDGIPSIDEPAFTEDATASPGDEVIVAEPDDGSARAYPTQVLNYHEVVNDSLGGDPVAVTWCPLCGSAVVFDRTVDGRELTFGVSGKLADDNLLMYDRETESEWKQIRGECISGPLAGERLAVRSSAVMSREQFRDSHPNGLFLDPPGGETKMFVDGEDNEDKELVTGEIDYSVNNYADYFEGDHVGSRSRDSSREWGRTDVGAKAVVLGIERDGDALGVPRSSVEPGGVATVTVGGTDVVVFHADDELYAYVDPGFEFIPADDGQFRADETTWDGTTGESADGRSLERVPAKRLFAFPWQDEHGSDSFYLPD